jgi:hypothetical protein
MSNRALTPKQELRAHLIEMHEDGQWPADWFERATYATFQSWHLYEHRHCQPNHHHIARGLDPATRPEGWNDGGCRHTAVKVEE